MIRVPQDYKSCGAESRGRFFIFWNYSTEINKTRLFKLSVYLINLKNINIFLKYNLVKALYYKYRGIIPLIILAGFCLYNFVVAFYPILDTNTYAVLNAKHYLAGFAVVINLILFFTYRQIYKYSLFITLILGIFDIINFMRSESQINFGPLSLGFHVTPLLVGLFTMMLYSERLKRNPVNGSEEPFEGINAGNTHLLLEEIEKFKSKYKDKSTEALTELCSDTRYSLLAKEAAKQVLAERLKQESK
jgi:hypothetical protein